MNYLAENTKYPTNFVLAIVFPRYSRINSAKNFFLLFSFASSGNEI